MAKTNTRRVTYLVNIAQPLRDVIECLCTCNVIYEHDAHRSPVVRCCDGVEPLLTRRIPVIHISSFYYRPAVSTEILLCICLVYFKLLVDRRSFFFGFISFTNLNQRWDGENTWNQLNKTFELVTTKPTNLLLKYNQKAESLWAPHENCYKCDSFRCGCP